MSMIDTPMMKMLGHFLDVTAFRHGVIAGNMANVDTPNYRTVDIDFRSELQRAYNEEGQATGPVKKDVPGLIERPDGNNVSLDRESLVLAQNQLQFRAGVALLRSEIRRIQSAISEGAR